MLLKPGEIELLAPARDREAGQAAINCGADAIYVGAPRFGAREQAGNSLQDIEALVHHAHRYWSRVYVALNTLLRDEELDDALILIRQLHDAGIDGLIIQDAGLLESGLPPLPLIASTQMHNHTAARIAFLEKVGFERAILARELSLSQICEIRRQSRIELECFIHGALCVSYSGQCYLSLARGSRSGNRGQCAQPCRLPYGLVDGKGSSVAGRQHLLSLRDLNLSDHLGDLIRAGITSFKIEGRLKETSYVKNIVTFYRRKLDALFENNSLRASSSGRSTASFLADPAKSFNRQFTTYFLKGRDQNLTTLASPKYIGEQIGLVHSCHQGEVEMEAGARALHNGDGIAFFDAQGELQGGRVNRVAGQPPFPGKKEQAHLSNSAKTNRRAGQLIFPDKPLALCAGTMIYRNHDHLFQEELKKAAPERLIDVFYDFGEWENGFALAVRDEEGIAVEIRREAEKQPARNPEQAEESVQGQLRKSGGTIFICREVRLNWQHAWFAPLSLLNQMRRDALDALLMARLKAHPLCRVTIQPNAIPWPQKNLDFRGNVLNLRARAFYERHGAAEIAPAAEAGIDLHGQPVMTSRYCIRGELGLCKERLQSRGFTEPLYLVDDQEERLRLDFRCDACEMDVYLAEQPGRS